MRRSRFLRLREMTGLDGPVLMYEMTEPHTDRCVIVFFAFTGGGEVRADLSGPDLTDLQLQVFADAGRIVGSLHKFIFIRDAPKLPPTGA